MRYSLVRNENTLNKELLITPKISLSPQKVIAIQFQLKYRELLNKIIRQLVKKSWIKELKKRKMSLRPSRKILKRSPGKWDDYFIKTHFKRVT